MLRLDHDDVAAMVHGYISAQKRMQTHIVPKFTAFRTQYPPDFEIDSTPYPTVFVTSDTHADFRKLLQMLVLAKLIRLPSGIDVYSDDVYDPRIIIETVWLPIKTLFVIAGDLVDGRRDESNSVDDPRGVFEFLIHMFLYNLRLSAITKQSEVLFTIGNHDYYSVLDPDPDIYRDYTSNDVWSSYFGNARTLKSAATSRSRLLTPFYENCPYFFISVQDDAASTDRKQRRMIGIIHASLHDDQTNTNMLHQIRREQREICDGSRRLLDFCQPRGDPIQSRTYLQPNACALIAEIGYDLIVVGHCQTHTLTSERKCLDEIGCTVLKCNQRLAFVDAGTSAAFQAENQSRVVEILRLRKTTKGSYLASRVRLDPN